MMDERTRKRKYQFDDAGDAECFRIACNAVLGESGIVTTPSAKIVHLDHHEVDLQNIADQLDTLARQAAANGTAYFHQEYGWRRLGATRTGGENA